MPVKSGALDGLMIGPIVGWLVMEKSVGCGCGFLGFVFCLFLGCSLCFSARGWTIDDDGGEVVASGQLQGSVQHEV